MMKWLQGVALPDGRGVLEIIVLAVIFYYTILLFRGTRGAAVLSGFVTFLILTLFVTNIVHLDALNWLLQRSTAYLFLAILIIFQPEIRRALAELGKQHVFANSATESRLVECVVQAMSQLSDRRIGALVAIEQEIGTRSIRETGTRIESPVSSELLATLFFPNTPLHDGGVIIADNRIMAAGCLFPLSQREGMDTSLGMRHRAALGMSEETDALIVVASEETGAVSVAYKGHLSMDFDEDRLRKLLSKVLLRRQRSKSRISRVKKQLSLTPEAVAEDIELGTESSQTHAG